MTMAAQRIHASRGTSVPGVSVSLYESIHQMPIDDWNALSADRQLFLRPDYLAAMEAPGVPVRYALFHRGEQPVGAASFHISAVSGAPLKTLLKSECPAMRLVARPIKGFGEPWRSRVVVCGSPFACGPYGFAFRNLSEEQAGRLLAETAELAKKEMDKTVRTAGILIKEFGGESPVSAALSRRRFVSIETEPSMVLSLSPEWRTFEDYLETLSSKYRVKARRAFAKSERLSVRPLDVSALLEGKRAFAALFDAVVARAPFKLGETDVDTVIALKRQLGEDFVVQGYFLGDEPVGILTAFVSGDTLEAGHVGFDYGRNKVHSIYPRMLYDYLCIALERRLTKVSYGRTASEIKSTLGAEPVAMQCSVRLQGGLLNTVLSVVRKRIRPEPFPFRRPFKQAWYLRRRADFGSGADAVELTEPDLDGTSTWGMEDARPGILGGIG